MAYLTELQEDAPVKAGDDASEARWFRVSVQGDTLLLTCGDTVLTVSPDHSDLAFDHGAMLKQAMHRLQKRKEYHV